MPLIILSSSRAANQYSFETTFVVDTLPPSLYENFLTAGIAVSAQTITYSSLTSSITSYSNTTIASTPTSTVISPISNPTSPVELFQEFSQLIVNGLPNGVNSPAADTVSSIVNTLENIVGSDVYTIINYVGAPADTEGDFAFLSFHLENFYNTTEYQSWLDTVASLSNYITADEFENAVSNGIGSYYSQIVQASANLVSASYWDAGLVRILQNLVDQIIDDSLNALGVVTPTTSSISPESTISTASSTTSSVVISSPTFSTPAGNPFPQATSAAELLEDVSNLIFEALPAVFGSGSPNSLVDGIIEALYTAFGSALFTLLSDLSVVGSTKLIRRGISESTVDADLQTLYSQLSAFVRSSGFGSWLMSFIYVDQYTTPADFENAISSSVGPLYNYFLSDLTNIVAEFPEEEAIVASIKNIAHEIFADADNALSSGVGYIIPKTSSATFGHGSTIIKPISTPTISWSTLTVSKTPGGSSPGVTYTSVLSTASGSISYFTEISSISGPAITTPTGTSLTSTSVSTPFSTITTTPSVVGPSSTPSLPSANPFPQATSAAELLEDVSNLIFEALPAVFGSGSPNSLVDGIIEALYTAFGSALFTLLSDLSVVGSTKLIRRGISESTVDADLQTLYSQLSAFVRSSGFGSWLMSFIYVDQYTTPADFENAISSSVGPLYNYFLSDLTNIVAEFPEEEAIVASIKDIAHEIFANADNALSSGVGYIIPKTSSATSGHGSTIIKPISTPTISWSTLTVSKTPGGSSPGVTYTTETSGTLSRSISYPTGGSSISEPVITTPTGSAGPTGTSLTSTSVSTPSISTISTTPSLPAANPFPQATSAAELLEDISNLIFEALPAVFDSGSPNTLVDGIIEALYTAFGSALFTLLSDLSVVGSTKLIRRGISESTVDADLQTLYSQLSAFVRSSGFGSWLMSFIYVDQYTTPADFENAISSSVGPLYNYFLSDLTNIVAEFPEEKAIVASIKDIAHEIFANADNALSSGVGYIIPKTSPIISGHGSTIIKPISTPTISWSTLTVSKTPGGSSPGVTYTTETSGTLSRSISYPTGGSSISEPVITTPTGSAGPTGTSLTSTSDSENSSGVSPSIVGSIAVSTTNSGTTGVSSSVASPTISVPSTTTPSASLPSSLPTSAAQFFQNLTNSILASLSNSLASGPVAVILASVVNTIEGLVGPILDSLVSELFGISTARLFRRAVSESGVDSSLHLLYTTLTDFVSSPGYTSWLASIASLAQFTTPASVETAIINSSGPLFYTLKSSLDSFALEFPSEQAIVAEVEAIVNLIIADAWSALNSGASASPTATTTVVTGSTESSNTVTTIPASTTTKSVTVESTSSTTVTYVIGATSTATITKTVETPITTTTVITTVSEGKTITLTEPCVITVTGETTVTTVEGGNTITVVEPCPSEIVSTYTTTSAGKTIVVTETLAAPAATTAYTTYVTVSNGQTVTVTEPCANSPTTPVTVVSYSTIESTIVPGEVITVSYPVATSVWTPIVPVTIYTTQVVTTNGHVETVTIPCQVVSASVVTVTDISSVTQSGSVFVTTSEYTSSYNAVTTIYSTEVITSGGGATTITVPKSVIYPGTSTSTKIVVETFVGTDTAPVTLTSEVPIPVTYTQPWFAPATVVSPAVSSDTTLATSVAGSTAGSISSESSTIPAGISQSNNASVLVLSCGTAFIALFITLIF